MNSNTPLIYGYVKSEYLTGREITGEVWECRLFGAASIQGRALLFHCQLNNGAIYYRLPISAFQWNAATIETPYNLSQLQAWDCASYNLEVTTYDFLVGQKVECLRLDSRSAKYITTFDWWGKGTTAEIAHEHKCLHLLEVDNGQYALHPNNFLLWHEKSNVVVDGSHRSLRYNQPYPSVEQED